MSDPFAPISQVLSVDDLYGPSGRLEAVVNTGREDARYSALVCHPHPPSGGTLHNKVVYHAMKVFSTLGLPVLRFNFRGAGMSEGVYDNGRGEQDDVQAALNWLEAAFSKQILFAGFSFGANVGLRACCSDPRVAGLIGLGVPIQTEGREYTYEFLSTCTAPKLFLSGDSDPFSPQAVVELVLLPAPQPRTMIWVEGADHFFQGTANSPKPKLDEMKRILHGWLVETYMLL